MRKPPPNASRLKSVARRTTIPRDFASGAICTGLVSTSTAPESEVNDRCNQRDGRVGDEAGTLSGDHIPAESGSQEGGQSACESAERPGESSRYIIDRKYPCQFPRYHRFRQGGLLERQKDAHVARGRIQSSNECDRKQRPKAPYVDEPKTGGHHQTARTQKQSSPSDALVA